MCLYRPSLDTPTIYKALNSSCNGQTPLKTKKSQLEVSKVSNCFVHLTQSQSDSLSLKSLDIARSSPCSGKPTVRTLEQAVYTDRSSTLAVDTHFPFTSFTPSHWGCQRYHFPDSVHPNLPWRKLQQKKPNVCRFASHLNHLNLNAIKFIEIPDTPKQNMNKSTHCLVPLCREKRR